MFGAQPPQIIVDLPLWGGLILENHKIDTLLNLFRIYLKINKNTNIGNIIFDIIQYYNIDPRQIDQEDMEKFLIKKLLENIHCFD